MKLTITYNGNLKWYAQIEIGCESTWREADSLEDLFKLIPGVADALLKTSFERLHQKSWKEHPIMELKIVQKRIYKSQLEGWVTEKVEEKI